jgi:hypothetical protein
MYKNKNKNKRTIMALAQKNGRSINTGYTVVPVILEFVKEKKSAAGNTYYFSKATTLNQKGVFVQYEQKRDRNTKEVIPFEPPTKRGKVVDEATGEEVEREVVDEDMAVEQDGAYGYVIKPGSNIMFNTFDRTVNTMAPGSVCKVSLIADMYRGEVSFKAGSIIKDADASLTPRLYRKFIQGSALEVIPTKDNIDPASFPATVDPKYYGRSFVLPLSDDTPSFRDVDIAVDPEDPDRFWGGTKEPAKLWSNITDPTLKFVSVNMATGGEKVANALNVVYTDKAGKRTFVKFGYMPNVWECFGITAVDKWAKVAGRMIFNAKDWYAYGSSRLVDIKSMAANADAEDGLDYGEVVQASDGDYGGYGGYEAFEGDAAAAAAEETPGDVDYTTTGFIANMVLNLPATAKAAGIPLPREYVEEIMARGKYKITSDPSTRPDNKFNSGWMMRVERREKGVFNVTELDELARQPFLEDTRAIDNLTFYGIFPVGDDGPYEHIAEEGHDIAKYARENKITPAVIFAVIE